MARNSARPGRTVTVFFIGLAVAYGLVALIGTWKPALGLDLEGGTQIMLTAKGNVTKDNLKEAAGHHRQPGQRLGRLRGDGDHPGRQPDRRPGARRHTEQPGPDRRTPGTAPVPPGRAGAAEHHARRRCPVLATSPGAGVTKPVEARRPRSKPQKPTARTARRRSSARTRPRRPPRRRRRRRRPARARPSSSPSTAPGTGGNVPTSTSQVTLHPGEPEGLPGRPDLA